jgi:hypothetical protein
MGFNSAFDGLIVQRYGKRTMSPVTNDLFAEKGMLKKAE